MSFCQLHFQSQEEVDGFFKKYDKNGDGVITKDELFEGPMLGSKAHLEPKNQPKDKANKVNSNFLHLESTKKPDGRANEHPLHKVSSKALHAEPAKKFGDKAPKSPARALQKQKSSLHLSREQIKEIFREHDIDGDGFLDFGELTKAFGSLDSIIPFYKARNSLTCADANGDGLISEDELDKLVNFAEKLYGKK